ncbi:MAG: PEGA domain-containing protein [Myxococcales bacterium]|nr:PEGA domain-containing protein [Myxococcales bacterium]
MHRLFFVPLLLGALPAFAAPVFEHAPPPNAVPGHDLTVTAGIDSPGGVFDPYLWYRAAGARSFRKISLKRGANGKYSATIPGAEIKGDIEYYLQAFDAADLAEATWSSRKAPFLLRAKEPAKPGMLTVRADPEGATIDLDGAAVGKSPWTGPVSPGPHTLTVSKPGYEPLQVGVTMAEGVDVSLPVPMRKLAVAAPPPPKEKPAPAPEKPKEAQWVDFITSQNNEEFGVEARGTNGIARCGSWVQVGLSCRLQLAPGKTHLVITRAMDLTRDLTIPAGRSEARLSRGAGPLPIILGALLIGGGAGSFFYFKHQADNAVPVDKIATWQYAASGGAAAVGLGLVLYGILSTDSIDLRQLSESR